MFSRAELKRKEKNIKVMLVRCAQLIGSEAWENEMRDVIRKWDNGRNLNYDFYEDGPSTIQYYGMEPTLVFELQHHHLSNYMYKCVNFLYLKQGFYEMSSFEHYYINDFEYDRKFSSKEKKVEVLYEKVYLAVKEAGLLRKMDNIYYPKSFLRDHADKTGLTEFIKVEERKTGKKLNHEQLAIKFFKSRDKWLENLHEFLDKRIIKLNI